MAEVPVGLAAALAPRYRLERELGRGGMAVVYLAEDLKHHRDVAIKVMRPEVVSMLGPERFLREIEVTARLNHPHVLPVHDSGEADGVLFFVMPFVEGESLRDRLNREKQLPLDDALQITREVADGLSYAHSHGVIHRDIKPENVMLEYGHAVIMDFGVARALSALGPDRMTATGIAVGTPEYMSPEQAAGDPDVDARSDIYALGCLLYEMLSGSPPFQGPSAQAVLARHRFESPNSIRTIRDTVPREIEQLIEMALAKTPADRFPTATQFLEALGPTPSGLQTLRRIRGRRRRRHLVLAVPVVAIAMVVLWWALLPEEQPDPNRLLVFPLTANTSDSVLALQAEDVTSTIRYALIMSGVLKVEEAWQPATERNGRLPPDSARAMARERDAGRYLVGTVLPGDPVHIVLELHDVAADSSSQHFVQVSPTDAASIWGFRAANQLLEQLLPSDHAFSLASLQDCNPGAFAGFLLGERAYRRAQFEEALDLYEAAVGTDSAFALAALRGAQAASWIHQAQSDKRRLLAAIAVDHDSLLPPAYAAFARGVDHLVNARADSAVYQLEQALSLDPRWPEAWMALGEVYTHLLPRYGPGDSTARAAFVETRRLDPNFSPVLYHLVEIAIRHGDTTRAGELLDRFRATDPDGGLLRRLGIMNQCVTQSPSAVDWQVETLADTRAVTDAAMSLTVAGLWQPECAQAAWEALLEHGSSIDDWMGGIVGLQTVLAATGRDSDLIKLLQSQTQYPNVVWGLGIFDVVAGAELGSPVYAYAESLRTNFHAGLNLGGYHLWVLGTWEAYMGRFSETQAISDSLQVLARGPLNEFQRVNQLRARSLAVRAALAGRDTAGATQLLETLTPTGNTQDLTWNPWECLGEERLALARWHLSLGENEEALKLAAQFDSPATVPCVVYLPASLELRERAARALGDGRLAEQFAQRRVALRQNPDP